jgi:hypothetical protein
MLVALPARADDVASAVAGARGGALPVDGTVDNFAQAAAGRIAAAQDLVHSDLSALLGPCSAVGEVIGYGPDVASVMAAFAGSPGHWNTITKSTWTAMGTGVTTDASNRVWVAIVFCTRTGAPPPTTATPTTAVTAAPTPQPISPAPLPEPVGPTIDAVQRANLLLRKVGTVNNLTFGELRETFVSMLLGEEEWRQPRVPSLN